MAGNSSVVGLETITFTDNMSFDGTARGGAMTTNGQLWIGSTLGRHVKLGNLTSPNGTVTIGYSSPNITLDVNGGLVGRTITGDTGGPLNPLAGNWNILGGPGVTTSGSGNTLTINSVVFTDAPATVGITSDSGTFATNGAPIILNFPATPAQGELIEVVCTTANAVALDVPAGDFIRVGTLITSSGGTATSTAIGDSMKLRFSFADQVWYAVSIIGTWLMA